MQNLGRVSPCGPDIWPRGFLNYTEQIVKLWGRTEQVLLPARRKRKNYPPSSEADGCSSLRSTFVTISVSLAWVGALTPI